jgi:hypothetical protein
MIDPISALGAAAAVIQFLDFTARTITTTVKFLSPEGERSSAQDDLETTTASITRLNNRILESSSKIQDDEGDIKNLCASCDQIAKELLGSLSNRKPKEPGRNAAFRAALKATWTEGYVKSLKERVDSYRQQISLSVLVHIRQGYLT